jgi:hypothetical protein
VAESRRSLSEFYVQNWGTHRLANGTNLVLVLPGSSKPVKLNANQASTPSSARGRGSGAGSAICTPAGRMEGATGSKSLNLHHHLIWPT